MKRVILLFAAVLFASIGWSQTMVITLNDGTTVKYDMGIVKSIEFTDEDSGNGQESTPSIIGTWMLYDSSSWLDGAPEFVNIHRTIDYFQFRSNGTYTLIKVREDDGSFTINNGVWTIINNYLTLTVKDGEYAGNSGTYNIVKIESNILVLTILGAIGYYKRISDSEIEKYL